MSGPLDVLSTGPNDPFRCGTDTHVADGEWFARMWEEHGFGPGTHLRRIHYRLLVTSALNPFGKPYANTERQWNALCEVLQEVRDVPLPVTQHDGIDRCLRDFRFEKQGLGAASVDEGVTGHQVEVTGPLPICRT